MIQDADGLDFTVSVAIMQSLLVWGLVMACIAEMISPYK